MRRRPRKSELTAAADAEPDDRYDFYCCWYFLIVSTMYMSEIKINPDQVAGGAEFRDRKQK